MDDSFLVIASVTPLLLGIILCCSIAKHRVWNKWVQLGICVMAVGAGIYCMVSLWLLVLPLLLAAIISGAHRPVISLPTAIIAFRLFFPALAVVTFSIVASGFIFLNTSTTVFVKGVKIISIVVLCLVTVFSYWSGLDFISDLLNGRWQSIPCDFPTTWM